MGVRRRGVTVWVEPCLADWSDIVGGAARSSLVAGSVEEAIRGDGWGGACTLGGPRGRMGRDASCLVPGGVVGRRGVLVAWGARVAGGPRGSRDPLQGYVGAPGPGPRKSGGL